MALVLNIRLLHLDFYVSKYGYIKRINVNYGLNSPGSGARTRTSAA